MSNVWSRLVDLAGSMVTGVLGAANGGTGIANNAAATLTRSGSHALTLTTSNTTGITLPTSGTLATLAGSEAFTNKSYNGLTVTSSTGTLTVAASSSLITSGANSLTLTTTGTTNVTLPTSGTLATISSSTTSTTFVFNGTGGTSGSVTVTYQKVGSWLFVAIPSVLATTGTSSTQFVSQTAIDAAFRPAVTQQIWGKAIDGAANQTTPGLLQLATTGIFTFFKTATATVWGNAAANSGIADPYTYMFFLG